MYNATINTSVLNLAEDLNEEDLQYLEIFFIDFLVLLANIAAVTADVIILYILIKFRFYKILTYSLIVNWAALDILHLLFSPGLFKFYQRVHNVLADFKALEIYFCFFVAFEFGKILTVYLLVLKTKRETFISKLKYSIWFVVVCILIFTNFLHSKYEGNYIMHSVFLVFTLTLFILCLVYYRKESYITDRDYKIRVTLALTYSSCWLIFIASFLMYNFVEFFSHELLILAFIFAESISIANVCILINVDELFKEKTLLLLGRKAKVHEDRVCFMGDINCEGEIMLSTLPT